MISAAELTGITYILGAVTFDEICAVEKEISYLRNSIHETSSLKEICIEALKEHLLESVSAEDVSGAGIADNIYFITGPKAFPEIPPELSQVIDILKLSVRKVNMDTVSMKLLKSFQKKVHGFKTKIESIEVGSKEIKGLETEYSDMLNLYYDYDSWAPGRFETVAYNLMEISKKLEALK